MLSKLTAVGCYHLTGNITYDNQEASNELWVLIAHTKFPAFPADCKS